MISASVAPPLTVLAEGRAFSFTKGFVTVSNDKFEEWAIVDVMGHQRYVGRVTEQVIAGQGFVRVDVPATEKDGEWSKLIGTSSIYAITPVSEDVARGMAEKRKDIPVKVYDFNSQMVSQLTAPRDLFESDDSDLPY